MNGEKSKGFLKEMALQWSLEESLNSPENRHEEEEHSRWGRQQVQKTE